MIFSRFAKHLGQITGEAFARDRLLQHRYRGECRIDAFAAIAADEGKGLSGDSTPINIEKIIGRVLSQSIHP